MKGPRTLTAITQEDDKLLFSTLDKFATEFGMQGSFLKANDFAKLMIRFAPSVPAGYLRLANLYMMQGKATAAVKTLDKALESVPVTYAEYAAIEEARADASHQSSICVDFIAKFPFNVVIKVMEHVTFEDRIVCITVSKKWHKILMCHTPEIWSDVRVDVPSNAVPSLDTIMDILPSTKSLYLNELTDVHTKTIFSKDVLIANNSFENIRSLTLRNCNISAILGLLALTHMHSLKELLIEYKSEPVFSLGDLLFVCPKLKSLRYYHEKNTVWLKAVKDMPIPDDLELESIAIRTKTIVQSDINDVVKRCPSLRNIRLMTSDFTVLEHIEVSCPNINAVIVNDRDKLYLEKDHFVPTPSEGGAASSFQHIGLCTLVAGYCEYATLQEHQIMPLIHKNKNALTTLVFDQSPETGVNNQPLPLSLGSIVARQLSKACFCRFPRNTSQEIASFLRNCPLLAHVSFDANDVLESIDIFNALQSAQNLKELNISSETVNTTGLSTFLDYHARLGKASMLRSISIRSVPGLTNGTAPKLALIGCLERLTVISWFDMTEVDLVDLISNLITYSTVEHLQLRYTGNVSPDLIARVGEIQSLRYLTLGGDYDDFKSITDDCVISILKNASQLKLLTMKRCPHISKMLWKRPSEVERTLTEIRLE